MVSGDSVAGLGGNHNDYFSTKRVPEPDIKHRCLSVGYIHYSKDTRSYFTWPKFQVMKSVQVSGQVRNTALSHQLFKLSV